VSAFSRGFLLLLAVLAGLSVAGCAGRRGGNIPYDVGNFGQPDAPKAVVAADSYKLAPQDTVTISVFQVPDLSRDYTVDLAGNLTMPLIGAVSALNLSTAELAAAIKDRLGAKYLQNPNVTVALKESASRVVTVEGSVRQPGVYQATGPLTLVQVIATARGVDEFGNPRRVAIFRTIGGQRKAAAFDLVSIRRGEMQDPSVFAGDTVVVDGSSLRAAQREILQNLPFVSFIGAFM
jgi:polysaccharide biosynthesis/export protein